VKYILHSYCSQDAFNSGNTKSDVKLAFVLAAGTDGLIALWNVTDTINKFCQTLIAGEVTTCLDQSLTAVKDAPMALDGYESANDLGSASSSSCSEDDQTDARPQSSKVINVQSSCSLCVHQCGINAVAVHRLLGKLICAILLYDYYLLQWRSNGLFSPFNE